MNHGKLPGNRISRLVLLLGAGFLFVVVATPPSHPWPVHVSVEAVTDTTVRVTWLSRGQIYGSFCSEPYNPPYDSYEVYFQPAGETSLTLVARTLDTTLVHDPHGVAGDYVLRGWRGDSATWGHSASGTTVPIHYQQIELPELNRGDTSWLSFHGSVHSTKHVDLYVTDSQAGSVGPYLFLASADMMSEDPGSRTQPSDNLFRTWFSPELTSDTTVAPLWDTLTWSRCRRIDSVPFYFVCRVSTDNFALISVYHSSGSEGILKFDAWYQPIVGLRLLGH